MRKMRYTLLELSHHCHTPLTSSLPNQLTIRLHTAQQLAPFHCTYSHRERGLVLLNGFPDCPNTLSVVKRGASEDRRGPAFHSLPIKLQRVHILDLCVASTRH